MIDLRLIKQFKTRETVLCEAGDVLYLPPRLGHFGVAESECMTWSIGFKAPNFHEMLVDYLHEFETANEHKRFTDRSSAQADTCWVFPWPVQNLRQKSRKD